MGRDSINVNTSICSIFAGRGRLREASLDAGEFPNRPVHFSFEVVEAGCIGGDIERISSSYISIHIIYCVYN